MTRIFVKPAPGLVIKDPATRQDLPTDGAWVEDSIYWRRRFEEQDVIDDTEAQLKREASEAKAAKGLKKEGDL